MEQKRTIPIQVEQDNFLTALGMAALFAFLAWGGFYLVAWGLFNVSLGGQFKAGVLGALHSIIPFRQGLESGFERLAEWTAANRPGVFVALTWTPRILAVIIGVGTFWVFHTTFKSSAQDRHLRGRRILEGSEALAAWQRAEGKAADGLQPHPDLPPISLRRETRHIIISGEIGAGKTQVILPLMLAAQARGDRMLVYDNKGDFTSSLPNTKNNRVALFAPWDVRSMVWDVARDVSTETAAREFAARTIVEPGGSNNPMWTNAAKQILVACLVELQTETPGEWGFSDLIRKLDRPNDELTSAARRYFPEAVKALGSGQQNVTTAGIEINLHSYISVLRQLAQAWPKPPEVGRGFSIHAWIENEKHPLQTVIIQHHGGFDTLAKSFNGAILGLASQLINSPLVGESKTRRLWFFLDEFPQLGKLESVFPLFAIGRSKGIRVVIGVQDIAQLREIYGEHRTNSLIGSLTGTRMFTRASGESAEFISEKMIGRREIERMELSVSGVPGAGTNRTTTSKVVQEAAMLPSQLSRLGTIKDKNDAVIGVRVLWLGFDEPALITELSITDAPERRPASIEADWTQHPAQPAPENSENAVLTPSTAAPVAQPENHVLAPREDIEGDEAGEEPPPPPSSPWTEYGLNIATVEDAPEPGEPEPNKIIQFPVSPIAAALEEAKEEAADPTEKAAIAAIAEVLPDPLGGWLHAAEAITEALDATPTAPAGPVVVLPGEPEQPRKKKKIVRKRAQPEAAQEIE